MSETIDILSREKFLEQLLNLVHIFAQNKENVTFSINGKWGVGKTWVINKFEEQLGEVQSEETATDKYLIFHYNAWQYDYYDEPIISIVSAMVESIDERNHLLPKAIRGYIKGLLKKVGSRLFTSASDFINSKIGIDIKGIVDDLIPGEEEKQALIKQKLEYDKLYAFRTELNKLKEALVKLSSDYSLVFVVDELDRCIPEYSIKVLERLHHITTDIPNMVTIIATDKERLEQNIKKVFGFDSADKYLEKFIQFELKLDKGKVSEKVIDKYNYVIERYDVGDFPKNHTMQEFWQIIVLGIDERKHEQLIKKLSVAHNALFSNKKKDYLFFCLELYYAIMIDVYGQGDALGSFFFFYEDNMEAKIYPSTVKEKMPQETIDFFENELSDISEKITTKMSFYVNTRYFLHNKASLQLVVMYFVQAISIHYSGNKRWMIAAGEEMYNKKYVDETIGDLIKFIDLYRVLA